MQLTDEQRRQVEDLHGFLEYALDKGMRFGEILATVGHDCGGLLNAERGFSPWTYSYADVARRLREQRAEKGVKS